MTRLLASGFGVKSLTLAGVALLAALALLPLPGESPVFAQPPANAQLESGLDFVPPDAALFVHADVSLIWNNSIFKAIRNADPKTFEKLTSHARTEFGLVPDDVKSVVVFAPKLKRSEEVEKLGIVLTFRNAFDKDKLAKGAQKLFPGNTKVKVVAVNGRMALVLLNLGDEYAKPQPAGATGPLSDVLKEASTGKHTAFGAVNLANLPEILRGDDLPPDVRPFRPLFHAQTIAAAIDLGKTIDLTVKVKTSTAGQAADCEKGLGLLLALIQNEAGKGIEELEKDGDKGMGLKDLLTLLKAGVTATKGARFSTLGNETQMTLSLPTDLPFASAYLFAKEKAGSSASRVESLNNLKQIALAMHNYHDTMGTFPPAAVCDKTGKPLLSWRVLILPYVEQEKLYKEFKLDEPWDSEHNKKLLAKMPKLYALPGKAKPEDTDTCYRVFVGNGAGFEWLMGTKITQITDGTSNTITCVTAAESVPWTKPDELEFDPDKDMTKFLASPTNGKLQAAMFDGSVRTFGKTPEKKILNALITRAGGESIPELP